MKIDICGLHEKTTKMGNSEILEKCLAGRASVTGVKNL